MKILLVGPLFANSTHGAEVGIYDALKELGHEIYAWDYRSNKFLYQEGGYIDHNKNKELPITDFDFVLCPGAGLSPDIMGCNGWKSTKNSLRILWNSEPIRLGNYRGRVENNRKEFQLFFTFDESEIPIYKKIGINALPLFQAFNPKWYYPIKLSKSQRFPGALCFIGSIGPKWKHRVNLINRVGKSGFKVHVATFHNAERVNHTYNMHDAVLNLGLYCPECENPDDLKGFGLQQRIFESIGAGRICITNEIPSDTNNILENDKHILCYNKDNLEETIQKALDNKNRKLMESNILAIRDEHTYKARMESLINKICWEK